MRPIDQTFCGGEQIRPMMQDRMYCGLVTHPADCMRFPPRAAPLRAELARVYHRLGSPLILMVGQLNLLVWLNLQVALNWNVVSGAYI